MAYLFVPLALKLLRKMTKLKEKFAHESSSIGPHDPNSNSGPPDPDHTTFSLDPIEQHNPFPTLVSMSNESHNPMEASKPTTAGGH